MKLITMEKPAWSTLDSHIIVLSELSLSHLDARDQDQGVILDAIGKLHKEWCGTQWWEDVRYSKLGAAEPVENFYNDLYAKYCAIRAGEEYEFPTIQHSLFSMLRSVTAAVAMEDKDTINGWGPNKLKGREDLIKLIHEMCNVTKDQVRQAYVDHIKQQDLIRCSVSDTSDL